VARSSDSVERRLHRVGGCGQTRDSLDILKTPLIAFPFAGDASSKRVTPEGRRGAKCPQLTSWSMSLALTGSLSPALCDAAERIAPVRKYYFNEVTALSNPLAIRSRDVLPSIFSFRLCEYRSSRPSDTLPSRENTRIDS